MNARSQYFIDVKKNNEQLQEERIENIDKEKEAVITPELRNFLDDYGEKMAVKMKRSIDRLELVWGEDE